MIDVIYLDMGDSGLNLEVEGVIIYHTTTYNRIYRINDDCVVVVDNVNGTYTKAHIDEEGIKTEINNFSKFNQLKGLFFIYTESRIGDYVDVYNTNFNLITTLTYIENFGLSFDSYFKSLFKKRYLVKVTEGSLYFSEKKGTTAFQFNGDALTEKFSTKKYEKRLSLEDVFESGVVNEKSK